MYGIIGSLLAIPDERDALVAILLEGTANMPGCLHYIIAKDLMNPDAIWITEVWESQSAHDASLFLPLVQQAITRGRSIIASFGEQIITEPIARHGLVGNESTESQ